MTNLRPDSFRLTPAWAGVLAPILLALLGWAYHISTDVAVLKTEVHEIHSAMGLDKSASNSRPATPQEVPFAQ